MALPLLEAVAVGLGASTQYVHHGSLAVDRSIEPEFRRAEAYLRRDPTMRHIIDDLERAPVLTRINGDSISLDRYSVTSRTVDWDPHVAARFRDGGRQSPALILGHELAHADIDRKLQARLEAKILPAYDDAEERRVIVGAESHAARTLGESRRHDHSGAFYPVTSSTLR